MKTASQQDQTEDGPPQVRRANGDTGRICVLDAVEAAALSRWTAGLWCAGHALAMFQPTLSARVSDSSGDSLNTNFWNGLKKGPSSASRPCVA